MRTICAPPLEADEAIGIAELMAAGHQLVAHVRVELGIDVHRTALHDQLEARGIHGLLGIHAQVEGVHQDLGEPLGVGVATDHAHHEFRQPIAQHHRRQDRMARTVAGRQGVGMTRLAGELGRPVVEQHARVACHQPGAEQSADAGHQRYGVALAVHGAHVAGVA